MWRDARRAMRLIWLPVAIRVWPLARLWYRAWGLRLDGGPEDVVWYFAYGANMHDGPFQVHRGMRPMAWRAGRITGYRLRFNLDGHPRGRSAPANISPDQDAEVWGVIYLITLRELIRLNASEGVPGRGYRPLWLTAKDDGGNPVASVTYLANGKEKDGEPSLRYITLLREGAAAHGLPEHWIAFLNSVEAAK